MNTLLPSDWRVVFPEDIVSGERSIVSGPFGSNIGKRFFVESGIPVIRGNNLTLGRKRFVDEGFVFLTEEKAKQFKNCQALAGDIVFTAAGTLGQVGLIPQNAKYPVYIISNKQLRVRPDPNIAFPDYLYYWQYYRGLYESGLYNLCSERAFPALCALLLAQGECGVFHKPWNRRHFQGNHQRRIQNHRTGRSCTGNCYDANRNYQSLLYTDHMIYSPNVPFFRDDALRLLDSPFLVSIITSPAPNAGEVLRRDPSAGPQIHETLERRVAQILLVAATHGHKTLVLGAWGCGVFRNKASKVADIFALHLLSQRFHHLFERIVFAIYERSASQSTLHTFTERFA